MDSLEIKALTHSIDQIRQAAETLIKKAQGIQAVERNAHRILASTSMLRMNLTDIFDGDYR